MSINKQDFLDCPELIEQAQKINAISMNPLRTTTGAISWKNTRTGVSYSVSDGGELALAKKIRDENIAVFGVLDIVQKIGASGETSKRPNNFSIGDCFFDTTIGKPIWYNGNLWVDSSGTLV